jgi:thiamine biosynthesis lipoprotein
VRDRIPTIIGLTVLLAGCLPEAEGGIGEPLQLSETRRLMATEVRIEVVTADAGRGRRAMAAAFEEIDRLEQVLSAWSETSQISAVNRAAGAYPVLVSPELFTVVAEATRISELTAGAFDITFAGCGHLWSVREQRIPKDGEISACLARVGHGKLQLDPQQTSLFLPQARMRLGLDGIGKGYRVDRAAAVLEEWGITDYVVDGGGDLRVAGRGLAGPWSVDIAHPREPARSLAEVLLDRGAVATSGDYQWFFERNGVRYHHILDPRSGRPARRSVAVTVLAPTAMEADALATGLFVLGPEEGLSLVERQPGVEALFIDPALTAHFSSGFPLAGERTALGSVAANGGPPPKRTPLLLSAIGGPW